MDNQNKFLNIYFKYLIFFTIGSFIGCIFETVLFYLKNGYLTTRQGLIYGPFIPVYGVGILLSALLLGKLRNNNKKFLIFLIGGVTCGIGEYLFSYVQEIFFHTYSWDYSKYPLNIGGRTSIIHIVIWGLLIYLFMQYIYPLMVKWIARIKDKSKIIFSIIITIFFIFNFIISSLACNREYERYKNIFASNKLDRFLDKYYNDKFLDKIYPNKRYKK